MLLHRTLAVRAALAAVGPLLVAAALAPSARGQAITVTDISPAGYNGSYALAVSAGAVVGQGTLDAMGTHHALLFTPGSAVGATDLNPAGFTSSAAAAVSGGVQVGSGSGASTGGSTHALRWTGSAVGATDLNPAGFTSSGASGISGAAVTGVGVPVGSTQSNDHALVWTNGTAASAIDLNPAVDTFSEANGVSGMVVVGEGAGLATNNTAHALVWTNGTAASVTDLNPAGDIFSEANGVSGAAIVGDGIDGLTYSQHALLWPQGAAGGAVDLHPSGFTTSVALAVVPGLQVGYAYDASGAEHAFLWRGTAASAVDLSTVLPPGFSSISVPTGIDADGDIVGYGSGSSGTHAFLWHLAPGLSVTATVSLQGVSAGSLAQPLTCTLTPTGATPGGVTAQTVTPDPNTGAFTLTNVPAGTYTLGVKGAKWLQRDVAVDTTGGSVTGLSVSLPGGDVNGDNAVSLADYVLLSKAYNSTPASANWDPRADLNCDGRVSLADYIILSSNYNKQGDK